jgi:pyridinium-3,5-bisthiocarboxylic acid mononucleotide nickel chelatase
MRIAYLECFSGISGDMFLGALLDAGVPFELFQKTVAGLNLGAELEHSRVHRGGISATKLDVVVNGQKDMPREEFWAQQHAGSHDSGAQPAHKHSCDRRQARSLSKVLRTIAAAPISEYARRTAEEIFLALGAAEAAVHNVSVEDVHFHEVGAADAIVDIVCAAVGAEALAVDQFLASPLNVGGGTVACAHGVMPVPAPATLQLLKNVPIYSGDIQKELVTPTGAAIVKVLVSSFEPRPVMTTERIGCGAGTRNFPRHANVLRLSVGETQDAVIGRGMRDEDDAAEEEIAILEANLDDLNPQLIGYIVDLAFAEGALDVFTAPVQMKKNRPGTVLTVLARPEHEAHLRALLFRESSTLGVRSRHERRYALPRRHETVVTPWGEVRMKVAHLNGTVSQYAPEYEDCRCIAVEHHVPLKTVMQEAIRLYLDHKNG